MLHVLAADSTGDPELILQSAQSGRAVGWIVPKSARSGDRVLFHLPARGLAARGTVATEPRERTSGRYEADISGVTLLPSSIPLAFIRVNHAAWKWPTYPRSYTTIDGPIEERLEQLLQSYQVSFAEPLNEGAAKTISVTVHERNPLARHRCIEHYGAACFVCGFCFGEVYGDIADGYIHVHHLKAVAHRGGEYVVDPIKDLRPICPNCHVVAHLRQPPLSIAELKRLLKA